MNIVICGLSITSSWGNGHATTYRGLVQALCHRGHHVVFLERDKPWYAANRDLPHPPFGRTELYHDLEELDHRFAKTVASADFVMVGSFVPEGAAVAEWALHHACGPVAFYDIDTPVTLAKLASGNLEYISRQLIPRFDLYLSFTGGPTLKNLERNYHAKVARPLYCSVDPSIYFPEALTKRWELGYLGTYSDDRQPALDRLILEPARRHPERRFVVSGSLYPPELTWPANVQRIEHLPPGAHREFYNSQTFTLNVTRPQMIEAGYSPSIRLFEAGACAVPIISDFWIGLDQILEPGSEILIARDSSEALDLLQNISSAEACRIGRRARARILAEHTGACRARQLEGYIAQISGRENMSHRASHSLAID